MVAHRHGVVKLTILVLWFTLTCPVDSSWCPSAAASLSSLDPRPNRRLGLGSRLLLVCCQCGTHMKQLPEETKVAWFSHPAPPAPGFCRLRYEKGAFVACGTKQATAVTIAIFITMLLVCLASFSDPILGETMVWERDNVLPQTITKRSYTTEHHFTKYHHMHAVKLITNITNHTKSSMKVLMYLSDFSGEMIKSAVLKLSVV